MKKGGKDQPSKTLFSYKLPSSSTRFIDIINPYTEEKILEIPDFTENDINLTIKDARKAFTDWKLTTPQERSKLLLKLADLVEKEKENLAKLESLNTGKLISLANSDIEFAIDNIRFIAGACRTNQIQNPGEYNGIKSTSILRREPLGVIASIVPWNYPFMVACWKLSAVAAGNTLIIKPSANTPLTAIRLVELASQAGFPKGVISIVTGSGEKIGPYLAVHPLIDGISFIGNTQTGKEISQLASSTLKKVSLGLGGKAPFIVFDDADLDKATDLAIQASTINAGQDCTAATRVYIQDRVYEPFIRLLKKKAQFVLAGDPSNAKTTLQPLISARHRQIVSDYIKRYPSKKDIIFQSNIPKNGFFFPFTIIKDPAQDSEVIQKEIFGPIITLNSFKTQEEAISLANNTIYGLSSSIWTKDITKALSCMQNLQFGEVWINDHTPIVSEMPHGGTKSSGHSSELSIKALEEFTYLKHVYVALD